MAVNPTDVTNGLGDGTILTQASEDTEGQIDKFIHLDIFTGSFFTGIALTVTCIVYLFKPDSEYLCWIFGLLLLILLPLTWLGNFINSVNSKYKLYVSFCLLFGIILNFVAILMVIIYSTKLNDRVKEYTANQVVEPGKLPLKYHINPDVLSNYTKIKILFTTNLVLCITIIMNFFVYTGEQYKDPKKIEPIMANNMYWWYKKIQNIFIWVDEHITAFISFIPIHGFLKMFLLFCGGFLFFFFSFFVKLKTTWQDPQINTKERQNLINEFGYGLTGIFPSNDFDIVNFPNILVETAGPVNFAALSSFFLSVIITIIVWFFYLLFQNMKSVLPSKFIKMTGIDKIALDKGINDLKDLKNRIGTNISDTRKDITHYGDKIKSVPGLGEISSFFGSVGKDVGTQTGKSTKAIGDLGTKHFVTILLSISFVISFLSIYLPNASDTSSDNKNSQTYILFCLCFLFSILGTPVVFMVFELLGRILGISLSGDLKAYFFPNSTTNKCEGVKLLSCPNRVIFSIILLIATFLGLLLGIFINGKGSWMDNNGNNSRIKIFVITIMSIMVGWFFALHLKFNMFTFLYVSVIQPARAVLFIFAPITVLGLAITQIVIASISTKLVGDPIKTDG